jgi:hypothetical protein
MAADELWLAVAPVLDALDELGVAWHLGGSVASGFSGLARSTQDIDVVADLETKHAGPLSARLGDGYLCDVTSIVDAVSRLGSFNVVHMTTLHKVDVFVAGTEGFAASKMNRRVRMKVAELGRDVFVASPEDIVLQKLAWFRDGGGVSERQWLDVLGVLRMQAGRLDLAYMRRWATTLGVGDLLKRVIAESA